MLQPSGFAQRAAVSSCISAFMFLKFQHCCCIFIVFFHTIILGYHCQRKVRLCVSVIQKASEHFAVRCQQFSWASCLWGSFDGKHCCTFHMWRSVQSFNRGCSGVVKIYFVPQIVWSLRISPLSLTRIYSVCEFFICETWRCLSVCVCASCCGCRVL